MKTTRRDKAYGILSIKQRLQGCWPRAYSIKYAVIIEIKLMVKISFRYDEDFKLNI